MECSTDVQHGERLATDSKRNNTWNGDQCYSYGNTHYNNPSQWHLQGTAVGLCPSSNRQNVIWHILLDHAQNATCMHEVEKTGTSRTISTLSPYMLVQHLGGGHCAPDPHQGSTPEPWGPISCRPILPASPKS